MFDPKSLKGSKFTHALVLDGEFDCGLRGDMDDMKDKTEGAAELRCETHAELYDLSTGEVVYRVDVG